jgi:ubiquinone/menaquinone biosynthesis C-methylase UbiE
MTDTELQPTTTPTETPLHRFSMRVHAWLLSRDNTRYESIVESRKRSLLEQLEGTVIELGPGGGKNFRYFRPSIRWIGVEPNSYADQYIHTRASEFGIHAEVKRGTAEQIPAESNSADAVVSTLVFCSVSDPRKALAEVIRVLKPGGIFAFIEHVAAPPETGMRTVQRVVRPFWKFIADGCNPDRETDRLFEGAGFERLTLERFKVSIAILAPHIAGTGLKPGGPAR